MGEAEQFMPEEVDQKSGQNPCSVTSSPGQYGNPSGKGRGPAPSGEKCLQRPESLCLGEQLRQQPLDKGKEPRGHGLDND